MKKSAPGLDETLDGFYRGRVRILQSKTGYRFALDAPLLADFAVLRPGEGVLELGTGCGVIPVLLGGRAFRRLTAVEIQPGLAALARRNVALNGLAGRVEVLRADFRTWRTKRRFDVVLSNPPYIKGRTGFLSASKEKSLAKHELVCDMASVLAAAARMLKPEGRAYFIYPAARADELASAAADQRLAVRARRFVRPKPGAPPAFVLAELGFGAFRTKKLRDLVLRTAAGADSAAAKRIYEGRPAVDSTR